jgi:predicted nucleic acid-binding protein
MAPHLIYAEVAHSLRRNVLHGDLSQRDADSAHALLIGLKIEPSEYRDVGFRVWELRNNITAYDAWYVALAEYLEQPLATLDGRLIRSPGPRCEFLTYEA